MLAALAAGSALLPATAWAEAPNVLIIVTDDQRAGGDTLSVMPETRRLLARGGTRYPNAFAATPLCCPSRATILTGRYAHNTGVRNNAQALRLDPATVFVRLLRDAGYRLRSPGSS